MISEANTSVIPQLALGALDTLHALLSCNVIHTSVFASACTAMDAAAERSPEPSARFMWEVARALVAASIEPHLAFGALSDPLSREVVAQWARDGRFIIAHTSGGRAAASTQAAAAASLRAVARAIKEHK